MFYIKKEQLRVFETAKFPLFEQKMIVHISNYFESKAFLLGRTGLRELIQKGYKSARRHGLTTGFEICVYIDLMIIFGCAFDTDPQLPWARDILIDKNIRDNTERMELLYERALGFTNITMGEGNFFPVEQFQKMVDFEFDELHKMNFASGNISKAMNEFWPSKFETINAYSFKELIQEGRLLAEKYGFTADENVVYYLMLMFLLGHRFDSDLQYPWLTGILNNADLQDEYYKASSLQFMVKHHLATILDSYHSTKEN